MFTMFCDQWCFLRNQKSEACSKSEGVGVLFSENVYNMMCLRDIDCSQHKIYGCQDSITRRN